MSRSRRIYQAVTFAESAVSSQKIDWATVPRLRAYRNGSQGVTIDTFSTIVFNTVNEQVGMTLNTSSGVVTVASSGVYQVTSSFHTLTTSQGQVILEVYKNGSIAYILDQMYSPTGWDLQPGGTALVNLSAGDTVQIRAYARSTSIQGTERQTYLHIAKVG